MPLRGRNKNSPAHAQPTDGKPAVEDEQTKDCDCLGSRVAIERCFVVQASQHHHGQAHSQGAPQHQWASPDPFDDEDRDDAAFRHMTARQGATHDVRK